MAEQDVELDTALAELLRGDAAGVVVPPALHVHRRARRRRRTAAAWSTAAVVAVLVLAAGTVAVPGGGTPLDRLAGIGGTVVIADGVDADGPWRLEWRPVGRCLVRVRTDGEGGACDLADPPTLRELGVSLVGPADAPESLVSGLVPTDTASVAVTAPGREPVEAEVVRAGDATLFVVTLPGVTGVERVVAVDSVGDVLDVFDGPTTPPPGPPVGPMGVAPGARGEVEPTWAVGGVSEDRRTLRVVAEARAGGPLRIDVEVPRPLGQGEAVLGACDPATPACAALLQGPGG